ncbi:MAG: hypothetical protein QMD36_05405 [Candidatus Aenigmarchaeota archaeon]|nr:hypothetical protein [Candidatus Aenigmarchaeota archaeon]
MNEEELDKIKQKIMENVEYLSTNIGGGNRAKAVKELTIPLAKIMGAHLADGNLIIKRNSGEWNSYRFLQKFSEFLMEINLTLEKSQES